MNRRRSILPQRFAPIACFINPFIRRYVHQVLYLCLMAIWLAALAGTARAADADVLPGAVNSTLDRAQAIMMSDPARALSMAENVERSLRNFERSSLSPQTISALARSAWIQAAADIGLNRPAQAEMAISRGLSSGILSSAPKSKLVADLHMARATALPLLGNIAGALKELQVAYAIYRAIGNVRGQALALQNIGISFYYAHDYNRANHYFDLSLEIGSGDPQIVVATLSNRGQTLLDQNKPKLAATSFAKARELAHTLHATLLEARMYGKLADAQVRSGELGAAEATIVRGLALAPAASSAEWQPELYRVAATAALQRGEIEKATSFIEKALAMKTGSSALLRDEHETAYAIYKARGEEQRALGHLEQFKKLDDEARNVASSTSAALMAAQFDYANQNLKIVELQRGEAKRDALIARNRQQMLMGLLAATGAIILLLLVMQVSLRRSRDRVAAANDDLSVANRDLEQALAARTEFLATTSHEIRTPLNGILGMTQVLLADRTMDDEVRTKIELVHGAGETMRALVDDLLDLAKMTTGEITVVKAAMNLPNLMRQTVQVWESKARAQDLTITLEMDDLPERICEDEVRLRQIVFNLLSNAIKFTDQGTVRVLARAVPGEAGERLRIDVVDTGIGIPADRLAEIFESFRQVDSGKTRRHSGTGLGLAICRNLAQAMGGTVTVSSVLGAGATFTIDLPLDRIADAAVPQPRATREPAALAEARMLLIEPNMLTQSILRALLGSQTESFTAAATIDAAKATMHAGDIDLLLIDAAALDGNVDVVADFAPLAGRTVLLWPQPSQAVRDAASRLGIAEILAKPITPPELVARLRGLYASGRRSEGEDGVTRLAETDA